LFGVGTSALSLSWMLEAMSQAVYGHGSHRGGGGCAIQVTLQGDEQCVFVSYCLDIDRMINRRLLDIKRVIHCSGTACMESFRLLLCCL
jgi:hypothetical protein